MSLSNTAVSRGTRLHLGHLLPAAHHPSPSPPSPGLRGSGTLPAWDVTWHHFCFILLVRAEHTSASVKGSRLHLWIRGAWENVDSLLSNCQAVLDHFFLHLAFFSILFSSSLLPLDSPMSLGLGVLAHTVQLYLYYSPRKQLREPSQMQIHHKGELPLLTPKV